MPFFDVAVDDLRQLHNSLAQQNHRFFLAKHFCNYLTFLCAMGGFLKSQNFLCLHKKIQGSEMAV
jgi:hypothetical protein